MTDKIAAAIHAEREAQLDRILEKLSAWDVAKTPGFRQALRDALADYKLERREP